MPGCWAPPEAHLSVIPQSPAWPCALPPNLSPSFTDAILHVSLFLVICRVMPLTLLSYSHLPTRQSGPLYPRPSVPPLTPPLPSNSDRDSTDIFCFSQTLGDKKTASIALLQAAWAFRLSWGFLSYSSLTPGLLFNLPLPGNPPSSVPSFDFPL